MHNLSTSAVSEVSTEAFMSAPPDVADSQVRFDSGMLVITVGFFGFLSNGFAMVIICHYKKMRQRLGMLLVINQCAVDMAASAFVGAFQAVRLHYGRHVSPFGGLAGELFCRLYLPVPHWGLMASSSYNLLAITTERYMMVVHPLYHKVHATQRKIFIAIALVWLIGPMYRTIIATPTRTLGDNGKCIRSWPTDNWEITYGVLTPIFEFFMPAATMATMYVRMIVSLRSKIHPVAPPVSQQNMSRSQRNLTKTLFTVTVVFISCWSFNEIFYFLENTGLHVEMTEFWHKTSIMLVYMNCSINPLIYVLKYREFRTGVRHLLGCGKAQAGESTGDT